MLLKLKHIIPWLKIYDDMGLRKGTAEQLAQGLASVDDVILSDDEIPSDLVQNAYKLRWQMQILGDDLVGAIATCQAFSRQFPESRFADQALLDIGRAFLAMAASVGGSGVEDEATADYYEQAILVFETIVGLTESDVKPEAQFLIAETIETKGGKLEPAIPAYQKVANNYPESEYAGESLGKLIQYHIESRDFVTARDMLERCLKNTPISNGSMECYFVGWFLNSAWAIQRRRSKKVSS